MLDRDIWQLCECSVHAARPNNQWPQFVPVIREGGAVGGWAYLTGLASGTGRTDDVVSEDRGGSGGGGAEEKPRVTTPN